MWYYYENGRLKERKNYKDGKWHGPWEVLQKWSNKMEKNFKDGIPHGLREGYYYENGNLESKSYIYKNDGTTKDYTGNGKYYYENGQLLQKNNYKRWKETNMEGYYKDGQLKWQHKYKQGKKYGLDEGYYGNGQVGDKNTKTVNQTDLEENIIETVTKKQVNTLCRNLNTFLTRVTHK